MTAPLLEAITMSDFRSVRGTIALPLDAPVVLLHGTNGAGKTTVMSALELALTGEVAELRGKDRMHLVHRGAREATVELATSAGPAGFHLDRSSIEGSPILSPDEARFFTERCYLAQRTLGQLLEIYQSADGEGDSALTRFVKELLRLDELDALLEGLDPVRDKRLVKRLVPEYAKAERELETERQRVRRSEASLKAAFGEAAIVRTQIVDVLTKLEAPAAVREELEPEGAAAKWLEATDDEMALVELVGTRREVVALRSRWSELSSTEAAKVSAASEASERGARDAADAWWRSHGATLEALLSELRADFPGLPSAVALADPSTVHTLALEQVAAEAQRLNALVASDDFSLAEIAQIDARIATARSRIAAIDEQLASSETASAAQDLGRALAALIPHLHDEHCLVCGRNYSEVSHQPLKAHLASRVSELGERAERLQSLAKARLEAVSDLRSSEDARKVSAARLMEPANKVAAKAKAGRLEGARRRLADMAVGVAEGADIIRRAIEAERARALVREQDRASAELRTAVTALAISLALPPVDEAIALDDAIGGLEGHVGARIDALESRDALRRTARKQLDELTEQMRVQGELQASVAESKAAQLQTQRAIGNVERRRQLMRKVRSEAQTSRSRIVRRVFNSSLNRTWRDLFVRLAPEEPFIPAFSVPETVGERVTANLETLHRDGKPGGSPGAMLSAGNLNTAALTLFLALHLSTEPRLPWLILDDPVQSMDEVHISQFAALLRTLAKEHGRRVIISVHEQPLFEYLALELSPAKPGDSLVTVELSRSRDGASIAQPKFFTYEEDTALAAM